MCTRDWIMLIGFGALIVFVVGLLLLGGFCKPDPEKGWTYLPSTRRRPLSSWKPPQYVSVLYFIVEMNLPIAVIFLVVLHANKEMMFATCRVF